ncbi:MAG TPA: acylase [Candidatus Limnocylindrales bacterium]
MRRMRAITAMFAATMLTMILPAPAPASSHRSGHFTAVIQRASYGVPHITAANYASLGFGVGYVQAEDNICVIAEKVVTVDGRRALHFGATDANVRSDLFFQKAKDDRAADGVVSRSEDARDLARGFAAGFNHYLRRVGGAAGVTDPRCAGKPWVRPIDESDLWRTTYASLVRAGSRALLDGIVAAAPPGTSAAPPGTSAAAPGTSAAAPGTSAAAPGTSAAAPGTPAAQTMTAPELDLDLDLDQLDLDLDQLDRGDGSNAYGLGREATASGAGMVLANPHFPWDGSERFYRMHLRIPGRYDVEGASLIGDSLVQIGHNATIAWSHTVSTARRFVLHRLTLVPGDPTSYLVDGVARRMKARTVTVSVPVPGGGTAPVTRTLYDTHFGPVVVGLGGLGWDTSNAYAITDVNATNNRAIDGWLRMGQARTVGELRSVLDRGQFLPWVNVIAADSTGTALYGDHSVIPRVTDQLAAACIAPPFQPLYAADGLAVLDGSTSACALGSDPDAAAPGILGPSRLPVLTRRDYVTNSNDSYWLANPEQPLTGYPRIIGAEGTARSLRTRLGLLQVQEQEQRFTPQSLWETTFGNRIHGGELVRDDLVALCTRRPTAPNSTGTPVDLTAACNALRGWDLRDDLASRGAHVFREFAAAGGIRFADPFVPTQPVTTPSRLAVDDPRVITALADAVTRLAGIPADAPLGALQTEPRGSERIPIHGGRHDSGAFNVISAPLVSGVGYPKIVSGSSFIMAVELGRRGPTGRQILSYSQSTNPNSPYYADQTRLFSGKGFDTIKYTRAQLAADRNVVTFVIHGSR